MNGSFLLENRNDGVYLQVKKAGVFGAVVLYYQNDCIWVKCAVFD